MDYPIDKTTRELQGQSTQDTGSTAQSERVEELVVPVLREEVEIHKELHKTGTVRIVKTVRELQEVVSENLTFETVEVQRVPVDLIVDRSPEIRTEGDVMIIPVVKEELIITRQLRVVEELRVTKRTAVSQYRETVPVRAEEVVVERIDSENLKTEVKEVQN